MRKKPKFDKDYIEAYKNIDPKEWEADTDRRIKKIRKRKKWD